MPHAEIVSAALRREALRQEEVRPDEVERSDARREEKGCIEAYTRGEPSKCRSHDEGDAHDRAKTPEERAAFLFRGGVGDVTEDCAHAAEAEAVEYAAQK